MLPADRMAARQAAAREIVHPELGTYGILFTPTPDLAGKSGVSKYGQAGWAYDITEAAGDGGVQTQDWDLARVLRNSGLFTESNGTAPFVPFYFNALMADSPSLYWRLGDTSGTTITDASGNGNVGTYSGITLNQTSLLVSDPDPCVLMSDSGTMHAVAYRPFPAGGESRTFTQVVVRASNTNQDYLWGGSSNSMCGLFCAAGSSSITFVSNTGATGTWTNALAPGVAKIVACTYNDTSHVQELFINGVSQGTLNVGGGAGTNFIALGSNTSAGQFNGFLDEFAIYPGILSAARLAAHAAANH